MRLAHDTATLLIYICMKCQSTLSVPKRINPPATGGG